VVVVAKEGLAARHDLQGAKPRGSMNPNNRSLQRFSAKHRFPANSKITIYYPLQLRLYLRLGLKFKSIVSIPLSNFSRETTSLGPKIPPLKSVFGTCRVSFLGTL
jgi:hypothetical protein